MIFKDYYKILGLETNKVSIDEIRVAFREQAKKYHPDVNESKTAEERFKDINEAYRILSEEKTKRKYDRIWYSHVGKKKENITREQKNSLFSILFGNEARSKKVEEKVNKKAAKKGENIQTQIDVSIEDAFYGLSKKILLRAVDGKMKSFSIKIPSGIRNGEKIRLIGQGKKGENGGKNGDLFIKINIKNSNKHILDGFDLYTDLLLTPWEAALGTRVKLTAIDESISVFVPAGICSGEVIKIPGKGYKKGDGSRGDLVVKIKIVVPKKISEEEQELYKKLSEISKFEPRKSN